MALRNYSYINPFRQFLTSKTPSSKATKGPVRFSAPTHRSAITCKLHMVQAASTIDVSRKVMMLKTKMELLAINCHDPTCIPGLYSHQLCPRCQGGQSLERSLSVHIIQEADFAMWRCFRASCGWAGQAFADSRLTIEGFNKIFKVKSSKQMTPEGFVLEPLGEKLIAYFGERMITEETLRRNAVMQMSSEQAIVAFTYRRNGVLVGCKYRTIGKKFWQEKGTEKWLYGVDDIIEANEIIIVEGEMDKLSVEEAGFHHCAIHVVTCLINFLQDKAYQYLWNCKEYLDKVSRIVIATDADTYGKALAEELARRLGKERCWLVCWPTKNDSHPFKDANEVLKFLGPAALREVIKSATPYLMS
ncbi:hypothetical protein K2173_000340 [Erythroxylum novogranatense]|uniref:Toprim domain-containing protein n=1 Tax=Erythroxylum novogranatense TaxID=1862640 RepID=A0AAV8SX68_9ROSI|nr:hypothetical protein K2173_000340 [Erythroxylum novogranatense]